MFSCVTEQHSSALNSPSKANKEMYLMWRSLILTSENKWNYNFKLFLSKDIFLERETNTVQVPKYLGLFMWNLVEFGKPEESFVLFPLVISCYERFQLKLAMCDFADILFDSERAICSMFHKLYFFLNIINCYLTVLKEICAKYQLAVSKLKFCSLSFKILLCPDERTSQIFMYATTQVSIFFRLEFDLSSICSYLLGFSQWHCKVASMEEGTSAGWVGCGGGRAWVTPGEMRQASHRRWGWSCFLQEAERLLGWQFQMHEAQKQSLWHTREAWHFQRTNCRSFC